MNKDYIYGYTYDTILRGHLMPSLLWDNRHNPGQDSGCDKLSA